MNNVQRLHVNAVNKHKKTLNFRIYTKSIAIITYQNKVF